MRYVSLCAALAALTAACGPGNETCEETEHTPNAQATLTALTYNTGLGPGMVRYSEQRTAPVMAAIQDEPFDLLCLQEVWLQEDSDAVTATFEDMGLHVLRADTRGLNETGESCEPGALDPVLECAENACAGWSDAELPFCVLEECRPALKDLLLTGPDCVVCTVTSAGHSPEEIGEICTTTGSSRIHDGGNGVILVSRYPFLDPETLHLPASFSNRVAQMARIELPTGPAEVACTHISATQPLPPLQSEWDWWIEEKEVQIGMIGDRLKERGACVPQVFMGDLNTSRENGDLIASAPTAYAVAESAGFESPAATWSPPVCSSCADNTFKGDDSDSRLIDHVMMRTGDATRFDAALAERTLDRMVSVPYRDERIDTHLSDHYGIRVLFDITTE